MLVGLQVGRILPLYLPPQRLIFVVLVLCASNCGNVENNEKETKNLKMMVMNNNYEKMIKIEIILVSIAKNSKT